MQDAKEEVRARLNIEDVIGEYVQLKRAGRSFKGLSPFGSEKTPSFFVSPDKNIWHDFSSNRGGDIFSFIMEVEGLEFREALELLARKAGVDLTKFDRPGAARRGVERRRALEATRLAVSYFQKSLVNNQRALQYVFAKRKLSKQVVTDFAIGYAPESKGALVAALKKRGFNQRELQQAGLTNRYGGDLFRGRMMIPLMDPQGQAIGFTGRMIGDAPDAPKYLNTPETVLYDKGGHVFGLSQAKEAIRNQNRVVIVEGNLDVVSSHQAGVKNVVATAGTAMTERHLKSLKRLTSDIRLAYDGDKAGIAATERAIEIADKVGAELAVVSLPGDYKDPDELIQDDSELWIQAIDDAKPAVEWVLERYSEMLDLNSARGKQKFIDKSSELLARINGQAEVRHYVDYIARQTGFSGQDVAEMVRSGHGVGPKPGLKPILGLEGDKRPEPDQYRLEDDALALASLDGPSQELLGNFDLGQFHSDERRELARYFARHGGKPLRDTPKELQNIDTYVKIVLLKAEMRYADWSENDRYYETARLLRQIEHQNKKQKRQELTNQLRNAERHGDDDEAERLRLELNQLIKEIARGPK